MNALKKSAYVLITLAGVLLAAMGAGFLALLWLIAQLGVIVLGALSMFGVLVVKIISNKPAKRS